MASWVAIIALIATVLSLILGVASYLTGNTTSLALTATEANNARNLQIASLVFLGLATLLWGLTLFFPNLGTRKTETITTTISSPLRTTLSDPLATNGRMSTLGLNTPLTTRVSSTL